MDLQIIFSFFIYFLILLFIGISLNKKSKSEIDFMVGNRSLNFWVTAISAHAADMSAWLFMAMPAAIFIRGLPEIWIALGLLLGMFLNWQFIAPKLRILTEQYNTYTLSSFFEVHFKDKSGVLRVITAIISIFFLTSYLSAGLIAMGYLFESVFGINYYIGAAIAVSVVVVYTYIGGFHAVAWTDLFQGIFLFLMIYLVPVIAFTKIGGIGEIQQIAESKDLPLTFLKDATPLSILTIIMIAFGWGLGYFGQPHILSKFLGIKDVKQMSKAKILGMSWQFGALFGAVAVGLVGIAYFPEGLQNNELVFVEMVKTLFHPLPAGFILCAIVAANISTMDSQILVCATVIVEDIYKRLFRRTTGSIELLKMSRFSVVLVGLVAFVLAASKSATVSKTVFYAWSGLGSSFGPVVIASLWLKSANRNGAIAGIIIGGVTSAVWLHINPYLTSLEIPAMIPGFFGGFITILLVSKLTALRKVDQEVQADLIPN